MPRVYGRLVTPRRRLVLQGCRVDSPRIERLALAPCGRTTTDRTFAVLGSVCLRCLPQPDPKYGRTLQRAASFPLLLAMLGVPPRQ